LPACTGKRDGSLVGFDGGKIITALTGDGSAKSKFPRVKAGSLAKQVLAYISSPSVLQCNAA